MLKACLDCLAGDKTAREDPYGTEIREVSRIKPWPEMHIDGIMFYMPNRLKAGDGFAVQGKLISDRKWMKVSLVLGPYEPDQTNVACLLEVNFHSNEQYKDQTFIKTIENGVEESITQQAGFFPNDEFKIVFDVESDSYISIYVDNSLLERFKMKHNIEDVRYLILTGDVEKVNKLEFEYA